jgi:hypothetical protein
MKAPDIPDYVSPIVGYRVWDWDATGLRSLNGEVWFPGRALTAKCLKTDHEPPADGCSCGVYAGKNYQHLQDISLSTAFESCVHGEVYLWGKVVEHDLGYRAQFAYPKSLVLPSFESRLGTLPPGTLEAYGADISLPPNILCVTVLGRGIGLVERADGSSECTSDSVCIRLRNNDLYIVPDQGIVWNCPNERWEVDLSGYTGAVILPQSKGCWKVLCGSREQKNSDKTPTPPKSREELSTLRRGLHRSSLAHET